MARPRRPGSGEHQPADLFSIDPTSYLRMTSAVRPWPDPTRFSVNHAGGHLRQCGGRPHRLPAVARACRTVARSRAICQAAGPVPRAEVHRQSTHRGAPPRRRRRTFDVRPASRCPSRTSCQCVHPGRSRSGELRPHAICSPSVGGQTDLPAGGHLDVPLDGHLNAEGGRPRVPSGAPRSALR